MEEPGGTMGRYWVAAHERVADGRRSVRRRGEETAAGGRRVESPRENALMRTTTSRAT
jgi:hypothetical protein